MLSGQNDTSLAGSISIYILEFISKRSEPHILSTFSVSCFLFPVFFIFLDKTALVLFFSSHDKGANTFHKDGTSVQLCRVKKRYAM
jgi:hypothetical protein